jgi:hypothetical protein
MTYKFTEQEIGLQPIGDNSTTKNHPLGKIVRGEDSSLGGGEFIYLQGIGSTVVGSLVNYDAAFVTELDTTALATPAPLAVAMSACVASEYGWYQISGQATVTKSAAVSFAAGAALAAGAGLAIAVVSGLIVNGAIVAVVGSAKSGVTTVKVMVNRPHNPSDLS